MGIPVTLYLHQRIPALWVGVQIRRSRALSVQRFLTKFRRSASLWQEYGKNIVRRRISLVKAVNIRSNGNCPLFLFYLIGVDVPFLSQLEK